MRKKLEDETNRRTKEQNNHHVVSERITNLEKEKRDLADRLKKENENMEKLKKSNAELSIAKTASGMLLSKKKSCKFTYDSVLIWLFETSSSGNKSPP